MLYCDRTDVSKGIDINKTSASKECDICHYWYFLNKVFKLQIYVCNRCYDFLKPQGQRSETLSSNSFW